jgi:hypothetical protein
MTNPRQSVKGTALGWEKLGYQTLDEMTAKDRVRAEVLGKRVTFLEKEELPLGRELIIVKFEVLKGDKAWLEFIRDMCVEPDPKGRRDPKAVQAAQRQVQRLIQYAQEIEQNDILSSLKPTTVNTLASQPYEALKERLMTNAKKEGRKVTQAEAREAIQKEQEKRRKEADEGNRRSQAANRQQARESQERIDERVNANASSRAANSKAVSEPDKMTNEQRWAAWLVENTTDIDGLAEFTEKLNTLIVWGLTEALKVAIRQAKETAPPANPETPASESADKLGDSARNVGETLKRERGSKDAA